MNPVVQYILTRLSEKSTWVSLGSVLTGMGVVIAPEHWQAIMAVGMGLPGLISIFLPARVAEAQVVPSPAPTPLSASLEHKAP